MPSAQSPAPPLEYLRLEIDRLWDGSPARPEELVTLTLRAEEEALVVEVDAPFHGDPPPPGPPGPRDRLWEHEVVELFLAEAGAPRDRARYTELELGPHGHYLLLRLEGARRPVESGIALPYHSQVGPSLATGIEPPAAPGVLPGPEVPHGRWRGVARLHRALLPGPPHRGNAYAIHGQGALRRHLAWAPVPGPAPDFHRLELFRDLILP
ncbi:MAG: hypothetical protein RBU30_18960 [Polyangia bacterium]|jgi:hypothetical protein|nr:hypothetical protein [Polyangia bacterium]